MKKSKPVKQLRVVLFVDTKGESRLWIAQCLEHDFAVQAETLRDAISAFKLGLWEQMLLDKHFGVEPLSCLGEAPDSYVKMFDEGVPLEKGIVESAPVGTAKELVESLLHDIRSVGRVFA